MKNAISYFYNIDIDSIRQRDNIYYLKYKDKNYSLEEYTNNSNLINELYLLSQYLKNNGIYCHEFILNINKEIITNINGKPYILFKIANNYNKKISPQDIINYTIKINPIDKLKVNDWRNLWINKIDYFEYQMNQFGIKYPLIRESFDYFGGVTENAIMLLTEYKNEDLYLAHRRIKNNSTFYDLFNPLNFVFDSRVRDIVEYFKNDFDINKFDINISFLQKLNFNNNEWGLIFARFLYPSFYFDTYEKIISTNDEEIVIKKVINQIDDYEILLKKLYIYINENIKMLPEINWLRS